MFHLKLFSYSVLAAMAILLSYFYVERPKKLPNPTLVALNDRVSITSQLSAKNAKWLAQHGIAAVVDLRPDGEAPDEEPAVAIEEAVHVHNHLSFDYIPVPHESIPEEAVTELGKVIARTDGPVLLYCRTGRRAARTYALVEASRVDGPPVEKILAMVQAAGFTAEDLKEEIVDRIAHRSHPAQNANN